MRFLDINNKKISLNKNSYLAKIDTISDNQTKNYECKYFVVTDKNYNHERNQINENTYNLLIDSGLEVDDNKRFPYYQIVDINNQIYEFNISSSIILRTVLVDDQSKYIYFLKDLKNNVEIEISKYCVGELEDRFYIEKLVNEEEYLNKV